MPDYRVDRVLSAGIVESDRKGTVLVEMTWMIASLALGCLAAVLAIWLARARQSRDAAALLNKLIEAPARNAAGAFRLSSVAGLPEPVARYFLHVLREGQPFIRVARFRQNGRLRTGMRSKRWLPSEAIQVVTPRAPGFLWNAHVHVMPLLHLRVRDAYIAGEGAGRVTLLSTVTVSDRRGGPELNAASLERYLAEAVWYPTALLPEAGVQWTAIDRNRARATLTDSGIRVSLEFHFNEQGEITRISTPGRWRSSTGGFRLTPWEGHFRRYEEVAGIRIPVEGEMGWYASGQLQLVWQGRIEDLSYEFAR